MHFPLFLVITRDFVRQDFPNVGVMHPRSDTVKLESSGGGKQYNVRSLPPGFKSPYLVSFDPYHIPWDYAMFGLGIFPPS